MRPEEEKFIEDKTGQNWLSMLEASQRCSYSQEYLSLLARRGKIFSQKIGRNWYTTGEALNDYLKKQSLTITVPRNVLGRLTASMPLTPEEPEVGEKVDTTHEGHSKVFEEFEILNPQLFQVKKPEEKFPSEKIVQPPAPIPQKQDDVLEKLDRLSDSLENFAERVTRKISEPVQALTEEQEDFIRVESQSLGFRFKRFDHYARSMMKSPVRMMTIMITAVVAIFIIAGGFSFGQVDNVVQQVKKAFKDADTVQGHFPGTHANEVLVLDKAGNVSIFGHIETQGQLRSYAPDGVAPFVVDSMTQVDNLNAAYLNGLESKDFILVDTYNALKKRVDTLEPYPSTGSGPTIIHQTTSGPPGTVITDLAFLTGRVNFLSSDFDLKFKILDLKLNTIPPIFQLPPTNTVGVGPITLNPAHLVSETLTVSGASTLSGTLSVLSDFSVDTNVFKVDTTNNRVGINTSSPETAFELVGTASISGNLTLGGTLTALGNIGIGTTSAPNQLTVIGSGSFTGQLKATRNPTLAHTGTWPSFINTADSTLYINPSSPIADGNVIAYVSGSDPKFVVDAEGDIYGNNLILTGSTTTATQTVGDLLVEGSTQLGDAIGDKIKFVGTIVPKTLTSFPLLLKASTSQTVDVFRIKDPNDNVLLTLDQGTGLLTASSGFNFALGGSTATVSYSRLGLNITSYSNYISQYDDLLISGDLEVDASAQFDSLLQVGTNTLYANPTTGNVGIGTTGPGAKLDIVGAASVSSNFGVDSNKFYVDAINGRVGINTKNLTETLEVSGNASISNTLYITNAGNVGIGTTNPANFKLQVVGNVGPSVDNTYSLGDLSNRWKDINVGPGSFNIISTTGISGAGSNYTLGKITFASGSSLSFGTSAVGTGSAGSLALQTAGTPRLFVASTGNIGIGTTSPTFTLDVFGNFHVTGQPITTTASGSGGTITQSGGYTIHTFNSSGTFKMNGPISTEYLINGGGGGGGTGSSAGGSVNYLVVAGGGGGGRWYGGGGGAGGMQTGSLSVTTGSYTITVGGGGTAGGCCGSNTGGNGSNSVFSSITSVGGGGGGGGDAGSQGVAGGSGGGGNKSSQSGGAGTAGQGNNGGFGGGNSGGGGGGKGAVGSGGGSNLGGNGGAGSASSISGSSVTYAGGGGGGATTSGSGGSGGGGNGGNPAVAGTNGLGGGGGGGPGGIAGAVGGSGIVIISYTTGALSATGGTVTTSGGNTIHTFTSGGTFIVYRQTGGGGAGGRITTGTDTLASASYAVTVGDGGAANTTGNDSTWNGHTGSGGGHGGDGTGAAANTSPGGGGAWNTNGSSASTGGAGGNGDSPSSNGGQSGGGGGGSTGAGSNGSGATGGAGGSGTASSISGASVTYGGGGGAGGHTTGGSAGSGGGAAGGGAGANGSNGTVNTGGGGGGGGGGTGGTGGKGVIIVRYLTSSSFSTGASNSIGTDSLGNVGIGTTVPLLLTHIKDTSADRSLLRIQDSNGTCDHNPGTSTEAVSCSSDARLKTDIVDASSALAYFSDFRVRDFMVITGANRATGVIAQELLVTHPEMVIMGDDGYYKVIEPNPWKLLKGIQELNSITSSQSVVFDNLQQQVTSLSLTVDQLLTINNQQSTTGSGSVTISSSGTGITDTMGIIANAVMTKVQNLWASGDIIAQGIKKTYYDLSEFSIFNFQFSTENWLTREITIAPTTDSSIVSMFQGNGAQAADNSKVNLEENGTYLATYGVDSTRGEIQLSGSSELINGEAKIFFDFSFSSIISGEVPLKVLVTPTHSTSSGQATITGQLVVMDKTQYGFTVKELNGTSAGKFDWLVIARRKGYEGNDVLSNQKPAEAGIGETTNSSVGPSLSPDISISDTASGSEQTTTEPELTTSDGATTSDVTEPTPEPSPEITATPEPTPESTPEPTPTPEIPPTP